MCLEGFVGSFPGAQSRESIPGRGHSLSKVKEAWKDLPIGCGSCLGSLSFPCHLVLFEHQRLPISSTEIIRRMRKTGGNYISLLSLTISCGLRWSDEQFSSLVLAGNHHTSITHTSSEVAKPSSQLVYQDPNSHLESLFVKWDNCCLGC